MTLHSFQRLPPPPPNLGPLEPFWTAPFDCAFWDFVTSAFLAFFSSLVFLMRSLISLQGQGSSSELRGIEHRQHRHLLHFSKLSLEEVYTKQMVATVIAINDGFII
jgi:hypothetical protein